MGWQAGEILLNNNQSTYADLLTFYTLTFKGAKIEYTIIRGDLVEQGDIYLSYNRFADTAKIITEANFDDTGVTFCASVNQGYVRLLYRTTDTGITPIFKHNIAFFPL
jgi:hypothetical protein